jgi:predicted MFS family arabinose efflux permease
VSRQLRLLLAADFAMRLAGIACYTLFIAAIYNTTGKASDIGFISAVTALPALLMALSAAKYTQRFSAASSVRYLLLARAVIFASAAALPVGTVAILVVAGLHSLLNQAAVSAKMSLDAELLDDENRRKYNSSKTMLVNVAVIVGPPFGGVVVQSLGYRVALLIMAAITLLVPLALLAVRQPDVELEAEQAAVSTTPAASLRYLRTVPYVAAIISLYCLVAVILEVEAPLMFPFVDEIYHRGSGFTGLLLGLAGIGGICGAILAQRLPDLFSESSIPWLIMLDGLAFLVFTQLRAQLPAAAVFALLGVMGAVTLVVVEGTVQQHVVKTHRPFVFSGMQFASGAGGASLGIATAFLAQAYGAKLVLAVCAIAELLAGGGCVTAAFYFRSRERRQPRGIPAAQRMES